MSWFYQIDDALWRLWCYATSGRTLAIVFGIGFAMLAISLLVLSRTRWGHSKPLAKCVVLSVLAHVWLLMYALGNRTVLPQGDPRGSQQSLAVSFEEFDPSTSTASEVARLAAEETPAAVASESPLPWEAPANLADLPQPAELTALESLADLAPPPLLPVLDPTPLPTLPPPEELADILRDGDPASEEQPTEAQAQAPSLVQNTTQVPSPVLPPELASPPTESLEQELADSSQVPTSGEPSLSNPVQMQPIVNSHSPVLPPDLQLPSNPNLPQEYALRQATNRLQLSAPFGSDADSEAAVDAGLRWLAGAQSPDGAWNAKAFGAGTETFALGERRYGTGEKADTGVSGLALLAFLSAGHTHRQGEYQTNVLQGLQYLLHAQMPSGDLSGPDQVGSDRGILNARMYCHSIATLALAEAYVMTHDNALQEALMKAAQYSIKAQDPRGGGWRYRPGDPGDLSQFGWQAMALKSVERSGAGIPPLVQQRMRSFLDSCAAGNAGGLARYRPGEGRPSETMTAEALACRLLLDYPTSLPAQQEATRLILSQRPGVGQDNVYFWYYATLALFQLQDENWRTWNQALKSRLLETQLPAYDLQPGSWNPDSMWGGYGGRVYSTAMSCLCLEVYYRYLPMYQRANLARTPQPDYRR